MGYLKIRLVLYHLNKPNSNILENLKFVLVTEVQNIVEEEI